MSTDNGQGVDLRAFGGTPILHGGFGSIATPAWGFGWVPPELRGNEQVAAHAQALQEMPAFRIVGTDRDDKDKAALWECSLRANGGRHFLTFRQVTGSCVGNGLGQGVWYLSAVEVVRLNDPEQVILPFYLLPYGRSRLYAGMRGRGEGSFGSAAAKAIKVDGILPANTEGLPAPDTSDGITWGRATEMEWSDGEGPAVKWLDRSRKHLVQTAAQVRTADEAAAALRNYYPLTIASDWGGQMSPAAVGNPPVRLNKRVTTWMHQMCVLGWWRHPEHGEIFYVLNSWGPNAHGQPAGDEPPGGFWIKKADMESIAKQGDTFALSQFNGFPAQTFSWDM